MKLIVIRKHIQSDFITHIWENLINYPDIADVICGVDAVIHLGAIIYPLADK